MDAHVETEAHGLYWSTSYLWMFPILCSFILLLLFHPISVNFGQYEIDAELPSQPFIFGNLGCQDSRMTWMLFNYMYKILCIIFWYTRWVKYISFWKFFMLSFEVDLANLLSTKSFLGIWFGLSVFLFFIFFNIAKPFV